MCIVISRSLLVVTSCTLPSLSFILQIKAYIQCGRFKNAYLIAIKTKLVDEVRNISEIAGRAGQLAVRDICEKWLAQQQQQQHQRGELQPKH